MIILTSNGLSNDKLIYIAKKYIKKGKAAIVVTADNEYKEKNYHIERLTKELEMMDLVVECFDFDKQSPSELMKYDVVEIMGGNPYYLLYSIQKNNFYNVLKYFAKQKYLIGCSAGALVLTPTLKLIDIYSPEMNIVELKDLSACNFTDIQILPHYDKFLNKYDKFEEKCSQYEKKNNCKVISLNDGEGIFVDEYEVNIVN
jgi:dipeptidase E